jgi:1-acyl-sn-glycerol-3-phosphate acyltransferase
MMTRLLRTLFTLCIVWPVIWLWLGLRVRHRERLPKDGPSIIVANHNSHMDVFALSLFPLRYQASIHPVAAADYFLRDKRMAWFALNILNIIPISRRAVTPIRWRNVNRRCVKVNTDPVSGRDAR